MSSDLALGTRRSTLAPRRRIAAQQPRQVRRPFSTPRGDVSRVGDPAVLAGQAAATDARVEPVPQPLERCDLLVDPVAPVAGDAVPVGLRGGPLGGQAGELLADLLQSQPD